MSRLSYATVYKDWKRLTQTCPHLSDIRLHDLRHTFATERVGLMGIEELRALMGHEHIQTNNLALSEGDLCSCRNRR